MIEGILYIILGLSIGVLFFVLNVIIPMFLGEQVGVLMIKRCFSSQVKFRGIEYEWIVSYKMWPSTILWVSSIMVIIIFVIVHHIIFAILGVPRIEVPLLLPLPMVPIELIEHRRLKFSAMLLAFIIGFVVTLLINWWYNMQRPTQSKTESN